ncbi:hypothetical protein QVD17_00472 [Tagetes erecta]|uniref:RING-type E3 ubiquitin transferase n=1 Tax=Tagetes erecta TaxID=13708 RepID=A0AAD8L4M4_TARER|nr:hypothetical protein QVD17_00472 [Tagetes erecta]
MISFDFVSAVLACDTRSVQEFQFHFIVNYSQSQEGAVGTKFEMAVVESICVERINDPVVDTSDKLYVVVGKDLKQSTLPWALNNLQARQMCLLHVHQPAQKIPFMGTRFRINQLEAHQVIAYHEQERQDMFQLLNRYKQICQKSGVSAEVAYIENDSIEKGIVEFIVEYNVRRLVMGAAADKRYSRSMVEPRSRKAIYVRLQAPPSCQIHFICKGKPIFTRQSRLDGPGASMSLPQNINSDSLRSRSVSEGHNIMLLRDSPTRGYQRVMSNNRGTRISTFPLPNLGAEETPAIRLRASGEWYGRSPSTASRLSTCSSDALDAVISEGSEVESDSSAGPGIKHIYRTPSPSSVIERGINDELYDQLVQAMAEAEKSKRDAFEESNRRREVEKEAIQAKRRANTSENLYAEELRKKQDIGRILEKTKEENESIKKELDEVVEDLRVALEQKSFLESQIVGFEHEVHDLEQKVFSGVDLLHNSKKERDELQEQCDDALRLLAEMKEKQGSCSSVSQLYTEFSFSEVKDATRNFDSSLKIGEGGYGSIFRGVIRHTQVAIKMLHFDSLQGPTEFQQEVNVLSKLRHPNLVTLIGACPDAWIIIYEYLSGGSLEDRLNCDGNTSPLSWQNRIRIAAELCSALIFLHSCGIVHGDLKPANLLLDKNMVAKLSDFGICRVLSQNELSSNNTFLSCETLKGTFVYMDPEVLTTGELTSNSDTYSFGIILLRLLTGKPALGLKKEVQRALNEDNLNNILDPTAGDWPFIQAQQLALLAMSCCDVRKNRADLASEAWRLLEPMRVSCGVTEENFQIPHYFICPIFQEIMKKPVVASDGFTYEEEALRGWLESGHNKSPMTNLELASSNLVPNHALRSAIQEWLQQP